MKDKPPSDSPEAASWTGPLLARLGDMLAQLAAPPLAPGLYLVSTPIGNLSDISLRALSVLGRAGFVYCEDTRRSRKLFSHFGLSRVLEPYHEHNAGRVRPRILARLQAGRSAALISDAGTPLISDPGYKLVREALRQGSAVFSVPGPSAPIAALTVSGLPSDSFFFAGFLPVKAAARQKRLEELAAIPATLIFFEAAGRIAASLAAMGEIFAGREAVIARELTKLHEEIIAGVLPDLCSNLPPVAMRGEIVVLVGPPAAGAADDEEIAQRLAAALGRLTFRGAVLEVAAATGRGRKYLYDLALRLKQEKGSDDGASGAQ